MGNSLILPFAGTVSTSGYGFEITNSGAGFDCAAVVGKKDVGFGVGVLGLGLASGCVGVRGESVSASGVAGTSADSRGSGVVGTNTGAGYGVSGSTISNYQPNDTGTAGVYGLNEGTGSGVTGTSSGGDGVLGFTRAQDHAGVSAVNAGGGFGVWASGSPAGHFEGNVEVTGNLLLGRGISSDGGGLKHLRVPVSVPSGGGFFQINWHSSFPDTDYTVVGSVEDLQINLGIQLQFVNLSLKTASSVNVFIANVNNAPKNAVIDLVAMHD